MWSDNPTTWNALDFLLLSLVFLLFSFMWSSLCSCLVIFIVFCIFMKTTVTIVWGLHCITSLETFCAHTQQASNGAGDAVPPCPRVLPAKGSQFKEGLCRTSLQVQLLTLKDPELQFLPVYHCDAQCLLELLNSFIQNWKTALEEKWLLLPRFTLDHCPLLALGCSSLPFEYLITSWKVILYVPFVLKGKVVGLPTFPFS